MRHQRALRINPTVFDGGVFVLYVVLEWDVEGAVPYTHGGNK